MSEAETKAICNAVKAGRRNSYHYAVDWDDSKQDAALAILKARGRQQLDRSEQEVAHWLFRVALGGVRDSFRRELERDGGRRPTPGKKARRAKIDSLTPTDESYNWAEAFHLDSPDAVLEVKQTWARMPWLPPRERQIVVKLFNGESLTDIGKDLGLTHSRMTQLRDRVFKVLCAPSVPIFRPQTVEQMRRPTTGNDLTVENFKEHFEQSVNDQTVHIFENYFTRQQGTSCPPSLRTR